MLRKRKINKDDLTMARTVIFKIGRLEISWWRLRKFGFKARR